MLKAIGESAGITLGEGLNGILASELGGKPAAEGPAAPDATSTAINGLATSAA